MTDEEELPRSGDDLEKPDEGVDAAEDQAQTADEDTAGVSNAGLDADEDGSNEAASGSFDEGWDDPLALIPPVDVNTFGTVTLHHPARDIVVLMDWGAARRLLKIYEQRREHGLADVLSLSTSQPQSGWVVSDLDEFVAISWMPGLPKKPPRTTIDPVVDQAA